MYRYFLMVSFLLFSVTAMSQKRAAHFLNPTGEYKLRAQKQKIDGKWYGYEGAIAVKLLSHSRLVMNFYVCKGYPSYNSGSFTDTLIYRNNRAVYTCPDDCDTSCRITFRFRPRGVQVIEQTADYNSGCGFGHAVVADGCYDKTSPAIPGRKRLMKEY